MTLFLIFLFLFQGGLVVVVRGDECKPQRCTGYNYIEPLFLEDMPSRLYISPPVRFPFRLMGYQPDRCGYPLPGFTLSCSGIDQITMLELPFSNNSIRVLDIDYESQQLLVFMPLNQDSSGCVRFPNLNLSASPFHASGESFFSCPSQPTVIDPAGSVKPICFPSIPNPSDEVYAFNSSASIDRRLSSCTKLDANTSSLLSDFKVAHEVFYLRWAPPPAMSPISTQTPKSKHPIPIKGVISGGLCLLLATIIAICFLYRSKRIEKLDQIKIERFLEDYKALKPTRYTYAEIKKITNKFKDELGQGGYGTVYKGKLSTDVHIAAKILTNHFKGNCDDFINEVRTIGKIYHVNVVRLVGYCADGYKRALVYEYLPNDTLQKVISSNHKKNSLGWSKLHDIALGIAKGIEYLHQGCDQRILHFDIKPHNILLDQNFIPKVSDFGLAKLCSKEQSAVSMTAARGTVGYIAPEVFSRNFGNVSHKSDVYSFGMLLLEMVGGRSKAQVAGRNTDDNEVYFPEWIYNSLNPGGENNFEIEEDGDAKIVKKLKVVGLWCIQWYPGDRPAMKVVIQMLEKDGEALDMPPNPFAATNGMTSRGSMGGRNFSSILEVITESE